MKKITQKGFAHLILIAVGAVLVGGAATGVASNSARPGDFLYGMDKTMEKVQHMFAFGEASEAKLHSAQAQERMGELKSLINGDASDENLDQAVRNYGEHIEKAVSNAELIDDQTNREQVLGVIAENVLVDQDILLEEMETDSEQVQAKVQAAMQHANNGIDKSYGQLSEAVQAQVRERVQTRAINMDRLMEQVQARTEEQAQQNQPEDAGEGNKPDNAGSDNANQGEESSKPTETPGGPGDESQGQGGN